MALIPRITKADNSIVKQMYSEWYILRAVTPDAMYWDKNETIDFCYNIILMSIRLDFWNWKINNAETLYTYYAKVYNEAVNLKAKKQKDTSLIIF